MKTLTQTSVMRTLIIAFMLLSCGMFAQKNDVALVSEDVPSTSNLVNFNAKFNEGVVKISWALSVQETQGKLIIEKSVDGVNFSYFGKLPAVASQNRITYSCRDNNPNDGSNYYRIKTVNSTNTEFIYDETAHVNTRESVSPALPLANEVPNDEK